jgi:hypothetical protein
MIRLIGKRCDGNIFYVHKEESDLFNFKSVRSAKKLRRKLEKSHPEIQYEIIKEGKFLNLNYVWCCYEVERSRLKSIYARIIYGK